MAGGERFSVCVKIDNSRDKNTDIIIKNAKKYLKKYKFCVRMIVCITIPFNKLALKTAVF